MEKEIKVSEQPFPRVTKGQGYQTLPEFKAELNERFTKLEESVKQLQNGFGELKGLLNDLKGIHKKGRGGVTDDGKHTTFYK